MANSTYTRIVFSPVSGVIDESFMNDIVVYKHMFKHLTGYDLESEEPEFTYGVDMRYNHHHHEDFHNAMKELPNLQIHLSVFIEPTHDGFYYHCTWESGLVRYYPRHIATEMALSLCEDDDLENLQE